MLPVDKVYSIYGQAMRTSENLDGLLAHTQVQPNLDYSVVRDQKPVAWEQAELVYQSQYPDMEGGPRLMIWRQAEFYRVRFSPRAVYDLSPTSIVCYPHPDALYERLCIDLLGSIMSWWLELQGIPTLHAAAVAVKNQAIAFLSNKQGGKSTLAAMLMQAGCSLLTDDVFPIGHQDGIFVGHPGYPGIRLWPSEAQYFLGGYDGLARVHPAFSKRIVPVELEGAGIFCAVSRPLACLYLPERYDPVIKGGAKIEIVPISPREAVVELVRYSFSAHIVKALGLAPQRLDFFARMIHQVSMRRLIYPSGFEHLPRVRDAVFADIAQASH